jgi:GMP synthase (glutamine-hydrolysing)
VTAPRLLVVQHQPDATGVELGVVEAPGREVPDELDAHPHLEPTMAMLRDAAARDAPALGICLGAQLVANALGGAVNPTAAYGAE